MWRHNGLHPHPYDWIVGQRNTVYNFFGVLLYLLALLNSFCILGCIFLGMLHFILCFNVNAEVEVDEFIQVVCIQAAVEFIVIN